MLPKSSWILLRSKRGIFKTVTTSIGIKGAQYLSHFLGAVNRETMSQLLSALKNKDIKEFTNTLQEMAKSLVNGKPVNAKPRRRNQNRNGRIG